MMLTAVACLSSSGIVSLRVQRRSFLICTGGVLIGSKLLAQEQRSLPTVEQIRARGENVWRLVDEINAYRGSKNLHAIALSPSMTAVAARQIVQAVFRRKREAVITGHGKALVLAERHTPWLLSTVAELVGRKGKDGS